MFISPLTSQMDLKLLAINAASFATKNLGSSNKYNILRFNLLDTCKLFTECSKATDSSSNSINALPCVVHLTSYLILNLQYVVIWIVR